MHAIVFSKYVRISVESLNLDCLYFCGLSSHSRFFTYMETSPVKGCKFDLCSGSLMSHTYCDTVHLYIMVISENPWHSPQAYCRVFISEYVTTCFIDLPLSRLGFEHPATRMRGEHYNRMWHCRGQLGL